LDRWPNDYYNRGFAVILNLTWREAAAKASGIKQSFSWLGWCLGAALMLSGAFGFVVTLLICLLALVNLGHFLGPNLPAVMSAYAVDTVFVAVGLGLYRPLRGWRSAKMASGS
jgi:hypothetical protein